MSFPAGNTFDQPLQTSSESNPPSTSSTDSAEKATPNQYRHILTHQEKKKQRMPKRKADSWPASILTDPDVLSLDDEGRFVLCKVCHVHYAVHGGKKPKPVIMNSGFRTRAWEVHKERTNSHRLHKKQDIQHPRPAARRVDEEHKNSEKPTHVEAVSTQQPLARPPLPKSHNDQQVPTRFTPPPPLGSQMASPPLPPGAEQKQQGPSPQRRVVHPAGERPPTRPWPPTEHDSVRRPVVQDRNMQVPHAPPVMAERAAPQTGMSSEQADGLMRWRNMHDDVSRALGSMHKRPISDSYAGGEMNPPMRMVDTEEFGGNNERVAKKLKSLDDEYDAKVMKRQEAYFDRRSDMYKQYWGTLRDVYNSANHPPHGNTNTNSTANQSQNPNHNQHQQHQNVNAANKPPPTFRRQQEAPTFPKEDDFTTPDESGSSEEMVKPVVVHDQALINALDRLTGVISKQFSDRYSQETALVLDSMGKLTNAVDDLRVHQSSAMNRMIQLQEQNLLVMEELLRLKRNKHRSQVPHPMSRPSSGSS